MVALAILCFFLGYPSLARFLILFNDQQVIFQKGILKLQGLRHVFSNRSGCFNSTLPRSYQCLISPRVEVLYLKMGKTDPLSSASGGNSLLPDWTPFWKMLVQNRAFWNFRTWIAWREQTYLTIMMRRIHRIHGTGIFTIKINHSWTGKYTKNSHRSYGQYMFLQLQHVFL